MPAPIKHERSCDVNQKTFVSTINQQHSNNKDGRLHRNNAEGCECKKCGKVLKTPSSFRNHLASVHSDARPFKCVTCPATFKTAPELRGHNALKHEHQLNYQCDQCQKLFGRKHTLRLHIRRVHENIRPFACENCPKKFADNKDMRAHVRAVHRQEKNFQCDVCEKLFFQRSHLSTHKQNVSLQRETICLYGTAMWFRNKHEATLTAAFSHQYIGKGMTFLNANCVQRLISIRESSSRAHKTSASFNWWASKMQQVWENMQNSTSIPSTVIINTYTYLASVMWF